MGWTGWKEEEKKEKEAEKWEKGERGEEEEDEEKEVELGHKGKGKKEMRREHITADLVSIVSKVVCTVL